MDTLLCYLTLHSRLLLWAVCVLGGGTEEWLWSTCFSAQWSADTGGTSMPFGFLGKQLLLG